MPATIPAAPTLFRPGTAESVTPHRARKSTREGPLKATPNPLSIPFPRSSNSSSGRSHETPLARAGGLPGDMVPRRGGTGAARRLAAHAATRRSLRTRGRSPRGRIPFHPPGVHRSASVSPPLRLCFACRHGGGMVGGGLARPRQPLPRRRPAPPAHRHRRPPPLPPHRPTLVRLSLDLLHPDRLLGPQRPQIRRAAGKGR